MGFVRLLNGKIIGNHETFLTKSIGYFLRRESQKNGI